MNIFKQSTYLAFQYLLSSIVYRLIIMVYGVFIIVTHHNIIGIPYYAVLIPLYMFFYILLMDEKWKYARLVLDLTVVTAVLYGKAPLDEVCFVYALFPLISAITHTGSHSKYWPVLVVKLLRVILLLYFLFGRQVYNRGIVIKQTASFHQ